METPIYNEITEEKIQEVMDNMSPGWKEKMDLWWRYKVIMNIELVDSNEN